MRFVRSVFWKGIDRPSMEYCSVWKGGKGWLFKGVITRVHEGSPLLVDYSVLCDASWSTREVSVNQMSSTERYLKISVKRNGRWRAGGKEMRALRGLRDVDISVTPATNTFPLKRLQLRVGESRDITVGWIRLPKLSIQPLKQRYTRLGATRYRYESGVSNFSAEIETDDFGLVKRYDELWERVAEVKG